MVVVVMMRRRLLVAVVLFSHMKALESGGGGLYLAVCLRQHSPRTKRRPHKKGEGHVKSTSRFLRFRAGLCQSAFIG